MAWKWIIFAMSLRDKLHSMILHHVKLLGVVNVTTRLVLQAVFAAVGRICFHWSVCTLLANKIQRRSKFRKSRSVMTFYTIMGKDCEGAAPPLHPIVRAKSLFVLITFWQALECSDPNHVSLDICLKILAQITTNHGQDKPITISKFIELGMPKLIPFYTRHKLNTLIYIVTIQYIKFIVLYMCNILWAFHNLYILSYASIIYIVILHSVCVY